MTDRSPQDIGKKVGQAGVNDRQHRDLMDRGGDQRTQGPRGATSSSQRIDESGKAKDDISRAPESGTP